MKILLKFPTRERPERFLDTFWMYIHYAEDPSQLHVVVSLDADDPTALQVQEALSLYTTNSVQVVVGSSKNKIAAINRDIPSDGWDIVVLAADDMIPQVAGWDAIIRRDMQDRYPDTDGCLWYYDGHTKAICTQPIMGRKYYQRFGYIYAPSYISLWADNEQTIVAQRLGRITYSDTCIIKHVQPATDKSIPSDALYQRNNGYFGRDKLTFVTREQAGFYLRGANGAPSSRTKYSQGDEQNVILDYFGSVRGTVLDIGANDGKTLSNSLALIERGWDATLVDAATLPYDRLLTLHAERIVAGQVEVFNVAIGDSSGLSPFYESGEHLKNGDTGLLSTMVPQEKDKWLPSGVEFNDVAVETMTVDELLRRSKHKVFDCITLDAEGMDLCILQQMDLSAMGAKLVCVEVNDNDDRPYTEHCAKHGLRLHWKSRENRIYIR